MEGAITVNLFEEIKLAALALAGLYAESTKAKARADSLCAAYVTALREGAASCAISAQLVWCRQHADHEHLLELLAVKLAEWRLHPLNLQAEQIRCLRQLLQAKQRWWSAAPAAAVSNGVDPMETAAKAAAVLALGPDNKAAGGVQRDVLSLLNRLSNGSKLAALLESCMGLQRVTRADRFIWLVEFAAVFRHVLDEQRRMRQSMEPDVWAAHCRHAFIHTAAVADGLTMRSSLLDPDVEEARRLSSLRRADSWYPGGIASEDARGLSCYRNVYAETQACLQAALQQADAP